MVKIPPPIRVKAERHTEEPMPVKSRKHKNNSVAAKIQSNSIPVEIAVATQTKPKHLNGNNVQMSDLPGFAEEKWRDTFLPTL